MAAFWEDHLGGEGSGYFFTEQNKSHTFTVLLLLFAVRNASSEYLSVFVEWEDVNV